MSHSCIRLLAGSHSPPHTEITIKKNVPIFLHNSIARLPIGLVGSCRTLSAAQSTCDNAADKSDLAKSASVKRKSSFPQWVRRKSLAFTQSMHGSQSGSTLGAKKTSVITANYPHDVRSATTFTTSRTIGSSGAPDRGITTAQYYVNARPPLVKSSHSTKDRMNARRMSTACDWKPTAATRMMVFTHQRSAQRMQPDLAEESGDQEESRPDSPSSKKPIDDHPTQPQPIESESSVTVHKSLVTEDSNESANEVMDMAAPMSNRSSLHRRRSARRSTSSTQSGRMSGEDDMSSSRSGSVSQSRTSSLAPRTAFGSSQHVSPTEKRFSIVHEIRALSPGNSLSGVFYCSSVVARKNSSDSVAGGAVSGFGSRSATEPRSGTSAKVKRRRTLNLPKQSSASRTKMFCKQHSVAAVCSTSSGPDTDFGELRTDIDQIGSQLDIALSDREIDLPSTGTLAAVDQLSINVNDASSGADISSGNIQTIERISPALSGRTSVQSEPPPQNRTSLSKSMTAERPSTAEPLAASIVSRHSSRVEDRQSMSESRASHRSASRSTRSHRRSADAHKSKRVSGVESSEPIEPRKFCVYFRWSDWMSSREEYSLFMFSPANRLRQRCVEITEHRCFDYVVLIFISLNCITLAMERPKIPPWSAERELLNAANYVFTFVFALEMALKVLASGLWYSPTAYFRSGWNIMDGILVGVSLFDLVLSMIAQRSPRILGILRVFRLLRSLRPLR